MRYAIANGIACVYAVTSAVNHYAVVLHDSVVSVVGTPVSAERYVRETARFYDTEEGNGEWIQNVNYVRGVVDVITERIVNECSQEVQCLMEIFGIDVTSDVRYCREFVRLAYLVMLKRGTAGHRLDKVKDVVYTLIPDGSDDQRFVIKYNKPCSVCRFTGVYDLVHAPNFFWDHIIHSKYSCVVAFEEAQRYFLPKFAARMGLQGGPKAVLAAVDGILVATHASFEPFFARTGADMRTAVMVILESFTSTSCCLDIENLHQRYGSSFGSMRLDRVSSTKRPQQQHQQHRHNPYRISSSDEGCSSSTNAGVRARVVPPNNQRVTVAPAKATSSLSSASVASITAAAAARKLKFAGKTVSPLTAAAAAGLSVTATTGSNCSSQVTRTVQRRAIVAPIGAGRPSK